jgi:hypothetical protein
MPDFYFSTNLSNDVVLCISPLTDEKAANANPEIARDPTGYFLYEYNASGNADDVSVIARVCSEDAAFRLSRILGMD